MKTSVVQEPPVYLDLEKTMERAIQLVEKSAREGGFWVVGCATALEASDIPDDIPYREELFPSNGEWVNPGDAVIFKPFGGVVAGPMHEEKSLLLAEIDVEAAQHSRRKFDASGHWSLIMPDVRCRSTDDISVSVPWFLEAI